MFSDISSSSPNIYFYRALSLAWRAIHLSNECGARSHTWFLLSAKCYSQPSSKSFLVKGSYIVLEAVLTSLLDPVFLCDG